MCCGRVCCICELLCATRMTGPRASGGHGAGSGVSGSEGVCVRLTLSVQTAGPPARAPALAAAVSPRHPFPVRPVSWFPARRPCLGSHAERCARPLGPSLPLGCSASCVAGSLAEGWWLCERTLVSGLGLAKAGTSLLIGGCFGLGGEWLGFSTWRTRGSDWPPPGPSVGMPDGPAATGSSSRARLTPLGSWQLTRVLAPPAGGGATLPDVERVWPCAGGGPVPCARCHSWGCPLAHVRPAAES